VVGTKTGRVRIDEKAVLRMAAEGLIPVLASATPGILMASRRLVDPVLSFGIQTPAGLLACTLRARNGVAQRTVEFRLTGDLIRSQGTTIDGWLATREAALTALLQEHLPRISLEVLGTDDSSTIVYQISSDLFIIPLGH
jgi:hypothetical protein